ncbi:MAG: hypothetical protein NT069_02950, partial [Planctomycetota bacterium]|nr:hypothetical protein [Planctomycetota bacterium]
MKGAPGFLLAVGLGLIGALVNWLYLAQKARQLDHLDFVGITENVTINPGDRFREEHFLRIPVPQHAVGGLQKAAVTWAALDTIVGMPATKSYSAGEILLWQDLKTPAVTDLLDTLGPNDVAVGVPIDTRTVVVQNLNPGASVSFIVPRMGSLGATPVAGTTLPEFVGPFEILALGTRKGNLQLLQTSGGSSAQETTMTIRVKSINGAPEEKWRQLLDVMRQSNSQPLSVMLHCKTIGKKGG